MSIRELTPEELDAAWPRLDNFAGDDATGRLERTREMLSGEKAYCLLAEDGDRATGMAVVDDFRSAWIFEDHISAIREFIATDGARDELLAAIDARSRSDGVDNLSRFTAADDPLLPWWLESGFVEFMAAFRRAIDVEEIEIPPSPDDAIVIRTVTDLDADWPKLWPLFEQLNQHHASLAGRRLSDQRQEHARGDLGKELQSGDALVMVAEDNGAAIATSSAELGETHADGSRTGYRSRLYIEEPYRGRGLAARFEALAVPWLRSRGVSEIERWIIAGNERPRQIWGERGYRPERLILRKALS